MDVKLIVPVLMLLASCSRPEEVPPGATERPVVTGVKVGQVELHTIAATIAAVGTVKSWKQSVLSAKIVAQITAMHVHEGDRVHADQVLVELDERDVKAQLQRATAGLREATDALAEVERAIQAAEQAISAAAAQQEFALATFKRYQALFERRSVAPQEYDEVVAKQRAATAEVERARAIKASLLAKRQQVLAKIAQTEAEVTSATVAVGYATLRAPFAGLVVAKPAEVGVLAAPGVPLLTLEEERYRLEATVPESAVNQVQLAQTAAVQIDAVKKPLTGPVVEIVPAADPLSRTFMVKVELPPESGLRSGMYGKVRFPAGQTTAVAVPRTALVERGQLEGVFALDHENVTHLRLVKTGKTYEDWVEILAGLSPGEHIIVADVEKVSDGRRVESGR
ncbi:MAG TPA: efflux RND transporter periplasmic adaptor subunit [Methylomirabilota bacterium]|nr:efflux RND transporter periplasmic adaptor subunit [Methylomirabilota bacterium]